MLPLRPPPQKLSETPLGQIGAKQSSDKIVGLCLGGIRKIKPMIHRVVVSQQNYDLSHLKKKLGVPDPHDANEKEHAKYKRYRSVTYNGNFHGGKISLFLKTFKPGPQLVVTAIGSGEDGATPPKLLRALSKALPDAKISSVEYAIDFYCKDHVAVANLYYLLRRYMYFKKRASTSMKGGEFIQWEGGNQVLRDENSVYSVWNKPGKLTAIPTKTVNNKIIALKITRKKKKMSVIKIYERGPNSKRLKGNRWNHEDVDRVRLEFTISRHSGDFHKHGIASLSSFCEAPEFRGMVSNKINFKVFIKTTKLPGEESDYGHVATKIKMANAQPESFQEEYLYHIKFDTVANISQHLGDAEKLAPLKKWILKELMEFDSMWA
jgi:hypothetical protein